APLERWRRLRRRRRSARALAWRGLEPDAEHAALTWLALDRDLAAQRRDDVLAYPEPEPGPDLRRLGGEERGEKSVEEVGRHAAAGVADLDHDAAGIVAPGHDPDLVLVSVALGDGLGGVDDEVEEDLAEACLVGVDRVDRVVLLDEACAAPDLVARQPRREVEDLEDVD